LQFGPVGCVARLLLGYSGRMHDEATVVDARRRSVPQSGVPHNRVAAPAAEVRPHQRVLHGMRKPANWLQLVRFGMVGGIGFVVNLVVYTVCVHALGVEYLIASVIAWLIAVANNFILNRHWTFDARGGLVHFQAARFLLVSLIAEGISLLILRLLVETGGLAKVPAQVLAVAAVTPLNFIGNKLWSFRTRA